MKDDVVMVVNIETIMKNLEHIYSTESWKKFYKPKLKKFFFEFKKDMNLERITHFDVEEFLETLPKNSPRQLNYYYALYAFYSFAYESSKVPNIMDDVQKPQVAKKMPRYINDCDIQKIKCFINNPQNKFKDRFLLAFVLFTGLSRGYIFELHNHQIRKGIGVDSEYYLWIVTEKGENKVPLNSCLQSLIKQYHQQEQCENPYHKVFDYSDTYISSKISKLSKKITGTSYPPQVFSDTFIKLSLSISLDIYTISKLALKSVNTIEKHAPETIDELLLDKQKEIVNML